jgi:hypothetical protein
MNRLAPFAGFALALAALPAAAATDLSRPGALERLKAERPEHYAVVAEIAQAGERANCGPDDFEALKARFPLDRMDCGFVRNNPPQRRMTFAVDGIAYAITVRLKDTAPQLIGR